ncbi:MAG: hypothetical protein IT429_01950 [Gemmataceae bacterium]|nr:hypothetical protein [Gemmataceae bacterium]
MARIEGVHFVPNWTTAAGALEGVLSYLGAPLPRHAIMGLTGHAWHFCLGSRAGVVALPSGPSDLDWERMAGNYARTGFAWEHFGGGLSAGGDWEGRRAAAVAWAIERIDEGRPLIGWDLRLHEHSVVFGYDRGERTLLVDDLLTPELGPQVGWEEWPSTVGRLELLAPVGPIEVDALDALRGALGTALASLAGEDGPADGQPRGTAGLDAWADALEGESEVDRAGNAYTLAVLEAARVDGRAFLADVAAAVPELSGALGEAQRALSAETQALAPLVTLFPFPAGGHGNVGNAGLRRAAAQALRRAASHERACATALAEARQVLAGEAERA